MQAVTAVFHSQRNAQRAVRNLLSSGVPPEQITFLTLGTGGNGGFTALAVTEQAQSREATEVVDELSGGSLLLAAVVPGVGPVTAAGLLGAAILTAAGASVVSDVGQSPENPMSDHVPEDEIFIYEDALRRGHTIVIALARDGASAVGFAELFQAEGAEDIETARHQWWADVRSGEHEHYSGSGKSFPDDEKFYRLGFEAALHARTRCMEFDQVSAEMSSRLEDLQQKNPGVDLEGPFTRGYQRGREYYQRVCDESRAA